MRPRLAFTHFGCPGGGAGCAGGGAGLGAGAGDGWLSFYRGASPFFATVISLVPIVLTQVALSGGTYTGSGLTGYDSFDLSLQAWYVVAAGALSAVALLAWTVTRSDGRPHPGDAARQRIALQLPGAGHGALAYRAAGRVRGGGAGGFGYGAFSGVVAPATGFVFGTELIIWVALGGRGTIWGRCWARS